MSKHKIHLSDIEETQTPHQRLDKKKSNWGASKILITLIITIGVVFFSPLPRMLLSLIPNPVVKSIISPVFLDITLDDTKNERSKPFKITHDKDLPILGRDSGICFIFKNLDEYQKNEARRGYKIAEIIALAPDNKEYQLEKITINEINKKQESQATVICQKFGKHSSILPKSINAIYIRPITTLTSDKIIWVTKKDFSK